MDHILKIQGIQKLYPRTFFISCPSLPDNQILPFNFSVFDEPYKTTKQKRKRV